MHLNSCYFSGGVFNPLLVFMSDPYTQGLYQLRAVKGEPLEFCLYTQNPYPLCVHKLIVNTNTRQCIFAHTQRYQPSHCTSSTQSKDDHGHLLQQNHGCYTRAFVWNSLTTLSFSLSLFCHFEVSECMLLYIFGDVSEWFNLVFFLPCIMNLLWDSSLTPLALY